MYFRLLFVFLLVGVCVALTPEERNAAPLHRRPAFPRPKSDNCTTCANRDTCCDSETCCNGGQFCCEDTATCCEDTCCDNQSESCCPDVEHGGVCCIKEPTFCCPRSPSGRHPSRCCPRWFVCCEDGKFGCCDPGSGLPMEDVNSKTAYGLFVDATFFGTVPFRGYVINTETGKSTHKNVQGFKDWGESSRRFAFDPKRTVFHLPQANFTAKPKKNDPSRQITLYSVNPITASTKVFHLEGATDMATGFYYNEVHDKIVMATYMYQDNKQVGYRFFAVDPDTGAVQKLSDHVFGDNDDWVGWFHAGSADMKYVYRLGYKNVKTLTDPGLGVTDISQATAAPTWVNNITAPQGHKWFISCHPKGNGNFVSLAEATVGGKLSLFEFNYHTNKHSVLATFGNAHIPPIWGPDADYLRNDGMYAALVVADGVFKDTDRWTMVTVDTTTKKMTYQHIDPFMDAETDSCSGVGLPN
eukprot:NODE_442_length_1498_cov_93.977389_g410_i0.p1 GENE.NODE_442_length_1498_cov_93.977389_g410_i0~~NODE_442_length_1498_cov_93.977389_g410_i0.p1  ORF type:complete len:470 (-),score=65.66 NODE_442_length_1498_cov_93.977389_g410_i0:32-1441(-)